MISRFVRPAVLTASRITSSGLAQTLATSSRNMSMFASSRSNALTSFRTQVATPSSATGPSCFPSLAGAGSAPATGVTSLLPELTPFSGASQRRWKARGHTYQPSTLKRKRVNGFLARMKTRGGKKVLARRKTKGRWYLTH